MSIVETHPQLDGDRTTAAALSFRGVGKVFPDGTEALRSITFDVGPSDFVTVVGPSGCGKSTLLKVASGLTARSSGELGVSGDNLGYVFQDATLLPWRTVQRNVELFAELHGMDREARHRAAIEAIELVGLRDFRDHYPRALSGGMRMRASLARSLTLKPPVFLFDEPFGALDELTRERLQDELLRLYGMQHFAALFITHSISEAVYLSRRVLVMSPRPGRIVADFAVPFPYPRDPDLRFAPEFASLSGQVSRALRQAHS